MNRVPVLHGNLADEPLQSVLEMLSLTRQLTCLEVTSPLGAFEGTIWLKSGQLLEVTSGARSGLEALRYLLGRAGSFDVYRAEGQLSGDIRPMMSLWDAIETANSPGQLPASVSPPSIRLSTGMQVVEHRDTDPAQAVSGAAQPIGNGGYGTMATPHLIRPNVHVVEPLSAGDETPRLAPPKTNTRVASAPSLPHVVVEASRPPATTTPVSRAPHVRPVAPPMATPAREPVPIHMRDPYSSSTAGPVLTVFANKGGVGKTTFAINLAVTLARRGFRLYLVDADPRNDVGVALAARRDTSRGLFDVLDGSAPLRDVILETALPGLAILPAGGVGLPEDRFQAATMRSQLLASVVSTLSAPGSIVIVDTPPGLRGITHSVLRASTHALAIVQAEPIALRSATQVPLALDALPARERPAFVGVVLNMLDRRVGASLSMLEEACRVFGADAVLDIAIPRSGAFIEASENGAPVALLDGDGTHAIGWIFESLASAILARAGLATPKFTEMRLL